MAVSEDGLIEGLYMPDHRFLWAIQWHPEFSYQNDDNSMKIFEAFIKASV
jgi:putative glutamine amidotransferase